MHSLRRWLARSAAVAIALVASESALAVPIGQFNVVGTVRFDTDDIDWAPAGGGTGNAMVIAPTSGAFIALPGTNAVQKDLNSALQPTGVSLLLADFLTFAAAPTLSLDLTFIEPGVFGSASCAAVPAAGQVCTPTGSPFNFVNLASGSSLSFAVSGTASDGVSDGPFTGIYTAQFVGLSYQSVLATFANGGSVTTSYSGSFEVVPEPGTFGLLGAALGLLALRARRRA
jgi:energy-converting hydrogenase Eha subunit E